MDITNPKEVEKFFEQLEEKPLKEEFKIPKKKTEEKEEGEVEGEEDSPKKKTYKRIRSISSGDDDEEEPGEIADDVNLAKRLRLPNEEKKAGEHSSRSPSTSRNADNNKEPHQHVKTSQLVPTPSGTSKDPLGLEEEESLTYGQVLKSRLYDKDLWQSLYAGPLPQSLLDMFLLKSCLLCNIKMDTRDTAKHHYLGRSHEKKMTVYLTDWARENRCPIPSRVSRAQTDKELLQDADQTYCHLCHISLSSLVVAKQHYNGKIHSKAKTKLMENQVATPTSAPVKNLVELDKEDGEIVPNNPKAKGSFQYFCMPCQVQCQTREDHHLHLVSDAHKEKALNQTSKEKKLYHCTICNVQLADMTSFQKHEDSTEHNLKKIRKEMEQKEALDVPVYEGLHCNVCQVTVSGQESLKAHLDGKRHKRTLALKQQGQDTASGSVGGKFVCEVCLVETTSQDGLDVHKKGKKHLKKLAEFFKNR